MKRYLLILFVLSIPLFAQEVDVAREELRRVEGAAIEFQNYQGPYEAIDSVDEITGIGTFIASQIVEDDDYTYFEKYRTIHVVDPDTEEGFDADIFMILSEAQVDHIDNIRRIVSSYLSEYYGYDEATASLIAYYITIYNAVYRQDYSFFESAYKPLVLSYLEPNMVGISTLYSDWSGQTQMVIPLSRNGEIIEPMELSTDKVVENLRESPDMAIETRKLMVELKEKVLEEEEELLEEEEEKVKELEEQLEERQREAGEEREGIEEERDRLSEADLTEEEREEEEAELEEREEALREEEEEIDEAALELEEQQEQVRDQEEEVEERREDIQEDREEIAEDQQAVMEEETGQIELTQYGAGSGIRFMIVRDTPYGPVSRMVFYDTITGKTERSAETAVIAGRTYLYKNEEVIVLALDSEESEWGTLTRLDPIMLTVLGRGEGQVYRNSTLLNREEYLFGVTQNDGEWVLAKFNDDLSLIATSNVTVDPLTPIVPARGRLFVQMSTGEIVSLSPDTLQELE